MILCPFKIYADFQCLLKNVDIGINDVCFSYTWYVLMIYLVKMLYYTEEKMLYLNLFNVFLMNILIVIML